MRTALSEDAYEGAMALTESDMLASESSWPAEQSLYEETPVESWRYQYIKRAFDFLSALFLVFLFAIPGVLIAAAILLTSKGPVFYREQRIGRGGRAFRIWKFRSMRPNAEQHRHIADAKATGKLLQWRMDKRLKDPRITAIGGFLRNWSLDELPQLINVLRGEMSLVGPRPIVVAETAFYGDRLPFYMAATPGLSGLWQVSGRSQIDYEERSMLDARYVCEWSLKTDAYILLRTIPAVLGRVGAC